MSDSGPRETKTVGKDQLYYAFNTKKFFGSFFSSVCLCWNSEAIRTHYSKGRAIIWEMGAKTTSFCLGIREQR